MALGGYYDLGTMFKRINALKYPNAESRVKAMEAPESAKTITVYVNGDTNSTGKRFVVNRKRTPTFETLLGDVTNGVKAPFGAVRNLYTPVGGTRVLDLSDLLSGKTYVASGGARAKFKKIEYGAKPRPRRARSQDPRGKAREEKASNPVVAQSRFQDFKDTNQKNIFVYANGISRASYKFLLKSPRSQNLDLILDDIATKISVKTGAAIRSLYTSQGKKIQSPSQIEDAGIYVACGNEKFKSMAYGTSTAPPSIDRQPRVKQVPPRLKPVRVVSKDRKPKKTDNKISKTAKVTRPLPPLKQTDDKTESVDAMEIEDDVHTKVEVPIEQQAVEQVDMEVVSMDSNPDKLAPDNEDDDVVSIAENAIPEHIGAGDATEGIPEPISSEHIDDAPIQQKHLEPDHVESSEALLITEESTGQNEDKSNEISAAETITVVSETLVDQKLALEEDELDKNTEAIIATEVDTAIGSAMESLENNLDEPVVENSEDEPRNDGIVTSSADADILVIETPVVTESQEVEITNRIEESVDNPSVNGIAGSFDAFIPGSTENEETSVVNHNAENDQNMEVTPTEVESTEEPATEAPTESSEVVLPSPIEMPIANQETPEVEVQKLPTDENADTQLPEVSVDEARETVKTPEVVIESSVELDEVSIEQPDKVTEIGDVVTVQKTDTEPNNEICDSFVTEKAAQRAGSPSGV